MTNLDYFKGKCSFQIMACMDPVFFQGGIKDTI